jgi:hypothetical protein
MTLDINWTFTINIPQLDGLIAIGERLVAELTGINEALVVLTTNQADGQAAMSEHLTAIEEEIRQLGNNPSQADLDAIANQIHEAAARSSQAATDLRAMTEQVKGMVPDTPPAR